MKKTMNPLNKEAGEASPIIILWSLLVIIALVGFGIMLHSAIKDQELVEKRNEEIFEQADDVNAKVYGLEGVQYSKKEIEVTVKIDDDKVYPGRVLVDTSGADLFIREGASDWVAVSDFEPQDSDKSKDASN